MTTAGRRSRGLAAGLLLLVASAAQAHGVSADDARLMASGGAWIDQLMVGARHMLSGIDHLLFLLGVVFYLRRPLDVLLYVSLFSLGHSASLLAGAAVPWRANAALVDAVIGMSVAYKAFDNLRGFQDWFGRAPDARWVVALFGLVHGLGLATSLRALQAEGVGGWPDLLAFSAGVELGQILALLPMLGLLLLWRRRPTFERQSRWANGLLIGAGFALMGWQLAHYASPAPSISEDLSQDAAQSFRSEVVEIPLAASGEPGSEREWTLQMRRGQRLVFAWSAPAPAEEFYSDFHGMATEEVSRTTPATTLSFRQGLGNSAKGTLVAPFDGVHGWYLQNQSTRPVLVRLQLAGFYTPRPDPQRGRLKPAESPQFRRQWPFELPYTIRSL